MFSEEPLVGNYSTFYFKELLVILIFSSYQPLSSASGDLPVSSAVNSPDGQVGRNYLEYIH